MMCSRDDVFRDVSDNVSPTLSTQIAGHGRAVNTVGWTGKGSHMCNAHGALTTGTFHGANLRNMPHAEKLRASAAEVARTDF